MAGDKSQEELNSGSAAQGGAGAVASANQSKSEPTKISTPGSADIESQVKKIEELTAAQNEKSGRPEIGAATLARMAGLATSTELKVLEGKLDLLSGRIANMTTRVERIVTMLGSMPSGNDLERIDVNVASLKSMLKDFLDGIAGATKDDPNDKVSKAKLDAFLKRHSGAKEGEGGSAAATTGEEQNTGK